MFSGCHSRPPSRFFDCRGFTSLTILINTHEVAQWQDAVASFAARLHRVILQKVEHFQLLRDSFSNERPREAEAAMPEDSFSLQSQKKDIMATARRFTLGIQD